MINIRVNNKNYSITDELGEKKLVDFLREDLGFTGTKIGCEVGACGACTILVNKVKTKSCMFYVKDVTDKEVLTIEGLENPDGTTHPLQQAFIDAGAIQCGFCTPGMVLASHALLLRNPNPSRKEIRGALIGNLCRCTGYQQIIEAIELASPFYRSS